MHRIVLFILPIFLIACTGTPQGVTPVTPFDKDEYLGEWYEIARLDHRFERGLTDVTAHYSKRSDGGIRVLIAVLMPRTTVGKKPRGGRILSVIAMWGT